MKLDFKPTVTSEVTGNDENIIFETEITNGENN